MTKSKKIALYTGVATLATLVLAGMGIAIQDSTFDHTNGPCVITKLTGNPDHQVKRLQEDGFDVGIHSDQCSGEQLMIIRNMPNQDPNTVNFTKTIKYKSGK